jgi:hypothetical protein
LTQELRIDRVKASRVRDCVRRLRRAWLAAISRQKELMFGASGLLLALNYWLVIVRPRRCAPGDVCHADSPLMRVKSIIRSRTCGSSSEAVGERTADGRHHGVDLGSGGGQALFAGPTALLLYKAYGLEAGILFPVYERTNFSPGERFRAAVNFSYFFWLQ